MSAGNSSRIAIVGELTIQRAAETRERLLHALAGAEELEVDLGEVSEFDSAGLQLLLAAAKSAAAAGKQLHLVNLNHAVAEAVEFLCVLEGKDRS